jgi:hypothetical protein
LFEWINPKLDGYSWLLFAAQGSRLERFFYGETAVKFVKILSGLGLGWALASAAMAQPAIFKEADIQLGEKLIAENKCVACHVSKVGGDGSAIYKPQGRINTASFLRGMVEQCNTQLNMGMFPEEVTSVAAVLNRDHYKFK